MGIVFDQLEKNHFRLSEMSAPDFCISKIEEDQALQTIYKVCIPKLVNVFNNDIRQSYYPYTKITEQEVRKNLKKISHEKNCEGSAPHTDYIRYSSQVGEYRPFHFVTHRAYRMDSGPKFDKPTLMTSWTYPYGTALFDVKVISEGLISETDMPLYDNLRLTRRDEERGLNHISKFVIPFCVRYWNKMFSDSVSEDVVRKIIKKTEHKIWSEAEFHDLIRYSCKVPTHKKKIAKEATFEFFIWRDREYRLQTGYEYPNSKGVVSYFVDDNTLKQDLTENMDMTYTREKLNNKKEVRYAINFLIKVVIPDAVKDHNDMVRYFDSNPEEREHRLYFDFMASDAEKRGIKTFQLKTTTPQEVSRNLKRVPETREHLMQFHSTIPGGMMFFFYIHWSNMEGWQVGYESYNQRKEWNVKDWDPYDIKNSDYTTQDDEDMGKVNEIKSSGKSKILKLLKESSNDRLTKMEEQYAYSYMTKMIVPKALEDVYYKHIRKVPSMYPERKYPKLTPQDVIKNIKKVRAEYDRVEYEAVVNDRLAFDFMIVKEYHLDKIKDGKEQWNLYMICGVQGPLDTKRIWYDIEYK